VTAFDFAKATDKEYAALSKSLESVTVGVLINNVGVSHEMPTPFVEESMSKILDIVAVNILAQLKITRAILPQMVSRYEAVSSMNPIRTTVSLTGKPQEKRAHCESGILRWTHSDSLPPGVLGVQGVLEVLVKCSVV
jgi:short-subunit dehydrogenase